MARRVHDLGDRHAGEVELHRQRLGEQRALPRAMRAPPPEPTLISTTPWASSVRKASRATMRLTPKRSAKSFSVPRKSPGRSSLAKRASRTWATI